MDDKTLHIYTDGACSGNPGPGGYAIVWEEDGKWKTLTGFDVDTTNNRMELTAAKEALKIALSRIALGETTYVEICTDSSYVYNAIDQDWLSVWVANKWKNKANKPVKNSDLWKTIICLLDKPLAKFVTFEKVRGHADNDGNNRADKLAVAMRDTAVAQRVKVDPTYVKPKAYRKGVGYNDSGVYKFRKTLQN